MKKKTFEYIVEVIRNMKEEGGGMVPTNSASAGAISGLSNTEGDLPPIDMRKRRYKKLPEPFRDLFRRKSSVQSQFKSKS